MTSWARGIRRNPRHPATRRRPTGTRRLALVATSLTVVGAVAACTSSSPRPAPTPSAPATSPGQAVTHGTNPFGAKWDSPRSSRFAGYLRTVDGGSTWYEAVWCRLEPKQGTLDWTALDNQVDRSEQLGFTVALKLRVGSCWADGDRGGHERGSVQTASAMPDDLDAYRAWVRSVVAHYRGRVDTYAVENEPNTEEFWNASAADYEKLVRAASAEIRLVPGVQVLDGGLSSTGLGSGMAAHALAAAGADPAAADSAARLYDDYYARRQPARADDFPVARDAAGLRRALTTAQAKRNLAFLDATQRLLRDRVVDDLQVHFYESPDVAPAVSSFVRTFLPAGAGWQVWEAGQFDRNGRGDESARAADMTRTVAALLAGGASRVLWLPLAVNDRGRNVSEPRYGLLDPDGTPRLAARVFAMLVQSSRGAKVVAVGPSGASGCAATGVAFVGPSKTTAVVWRTAQGDEVRTSLAPKIAGTTVTRADLHPVSLPAGGLQLDSDPVFVTLPGKLTAATVASSLFADPSCAAASRAAG